MNILSTLDAVLGRLSGSLQAADRRAALTTLVEAGFDRLPRPGGDTLSRWRVLASVAACDLSLVKLFEGHTDALAIVAEVDPSFPVPDRSRWGTWAAEAPGARVSIEGDDEVRLHGTKAWCSGAAAVTHGLLTAWRNPDDGPWLVAVEMDQPGVRVSAEGWQAVGMAASASVDVHFDDVVGHVVGGRRAYLDRPGFWQGGCGIAACWHGGAMAVGEALRRATRADDPHRAAALGAVDVALSRNAAMLREASRWIDRHPRDDAMVMALRLRASSEQTAVEVLHHAGRALGAAPFCRDARFARLAADLPVFIRQSHAERDLAALGAAVTEPNSSPKDPSWAP